MSLELWMTVAFILGLVMGCGLFYAIGRRKSATGTLLIDSSDPEKDKMSLQIDDLDELYTKSQVVLKIKKNA